MSHRLTEILRRLVRLLYRCTPKARYAVVWGWPDYEDNVLALERELATSSLRRVVLLMTDRRAAPPSPLSAKTIRVTKGSPVGWLAFLFARYVFFTHRCFMRDFPPNVVSVNLWHGMPIKRIGWLLDEESGLESTYVLATSPYWAEIMGRSMRATGDVLATGLPRNDRLFLDRAPVWDALGLTDRTDVEHLVAWLPTYRRSVRGYLTIDGHPTDSPFELDGVDPARLNELLAARRAFALVKPHPMAAFSGEQRWSHLLIVDSGWLLQRSLSLYQVLGATDALISDVSSVTIDYLLVDRPIVHALADLEAYRATRGFSVPDVEELLVGPVVGSIPELIDQLDLIIDGADPEVERRRRVRALSHATCDDRSARRLVDSLGLASAAGPQGVGQVAD